MIKHGEVLYHAVGEENRNPGRSGLTGDLPDASAEGLIDDVIADLYGRIVREAAV